MADAPDLLRSPVGQFALGALALVVGGALLFSLIGAVSDGDPVAAPTIAETPDDGATDAPATDAPSDGGTDAATDAPSDPVTDGSTDAATDAPTSEPTQVEQVAEPASIAIQVLDGAPSDPSLHDGSVACLESGGYTNLITSNSSSSAYDTTTVFFTAGGDNEAIARQVAAQIGVGTVSQKPDNLSDTVPVHIVVGADAQTC